MRHEINSMNNEIFLNGECEKNSWAENSHSNGNWAIQLTYLYKRKRPPINRLWANGDQEYQVL
jgi:hypothetical protein